MTITVKAMTGGGFSDVLDELSALRLTVFREWPYLYDGDARYEAEYLATFSQAAGAVVVCAFDDATMIGAATASPLGGHTAEFVPLFKARGFDPDEVFYCGESVLLPQYRGRGIGHAFFDQREAHASALNAAGARFRYSTFCGVIRRTDDQRTPPGYRALDSFWRKRGYEKVDNLRGRYDWREIGSNEETGHDMQFWLRELNPTGGSAASA
jgi:GNAT superfamily N-acetyltransferase